jgi:hypothetical protein
MSARNPSHNKAAVLARFPKAYLHSWKGCWVIYTGNPVNRAIGTGKTPRLAWTAATKTEPSWEDTALQSKHSTTPATIRSKE